VGFHILGLTLAGASLVMVLGSVWSNRTDPIDIWALAWLVARWVAYPVVCAVGWIIARLFDDTDV